ncbi:hypothetical protein CRV02_07205 [Arcobacter sp. CECT 8989]|uniref:WD40 repeat domain-containing protein n=1 Tax=Arcobacter sp. CECT 8989 TaxID=2044509 RepID=UPI00100A42F5|nr:WD40 repeat domain-containing protein [Arcobacter sp. CECT 8989]RXK01660.1 hypothetical protein CRV02_07205 [Arcobacter sp. CECT 8989]
MSKLFLSFFILVVSSFALEEVTPTYSLKATGAVQGIVYKDELLYTGTANGTVEIFDTKEKKIIKTINLPKIKDFMGDTIPAKVYSIDLIEDKILIVTQGMKGYRNLWIYENEELKKLIGIEKKFFIQKASFISDTRVVFALLSNQLGIFDIEKNEVTVLTQVSQSSFSHFALNENRSKLITTDESGVIRVLKTSDLVVEKRLKALNLDRVYQLDFKKGKVLTAGQDRKAVFYDSFSSYALNFDFLLYSCALSKNAKYGAIAYNEENEILVFNTSSKKYLYKLIGQDATLTQILFISDKEIFASSDSQTINFWRLK